MSHMRLHGLAAWLCVASLVACASGTDGDDSPVTLANAPNDEINGAKTPDAEKAPDFEPKFETPATDPSKDPAPAGADECVDNGDPGGTESTAQQLPETDDCDDAMKPITGKLKSTADVDVYRVKTKDAWCVRETSFELETPGAELCVFMRCNNGNQEGFKGCDSGTEATSETGLKGCCQAGPGKAVPKLGCSGIFSGYDDSAEFTIRVRQPQANRCLPYRVRYRY